LSAMSESLRFTALYEKSEAGGTVEKSEAGGTVEVPPRARTEPLELTIAA
jgi:hypothetical protein